MTSKHTPGPWRSVLKDNNDLEVHAGSAEEPVFVALVSEASGETEQPASAWADADLIAQAPLMAALLRSIVDAGVLNGTPFHNPAVEALAAIEE